MLKSNVLFAGIFRAISVCLRLLDMSRFTVRIFLRFSVVFAALFLLCGCSDKFTNISEQMEMAKNLPPWQVAVVIGISTLITEDVATIIAGILAGNNLLTFWWALAGSLGGVFFGDYGLYALGYFGGLPLLRKKPFCWWFKEERIQQGAELFEQHGGKIIFTSRLVPGTRFPIYLSAGILRYPFWKYCIFLFIACTASTLILLWLAMKLGKVLLDWLKVYETYAVPVFLAVVVIIWVTVKLVEILATRRSRLKFLAKCRSLWRRFRGTHKR